MPQSTGNTKRAPVFKRIAQILTHTPPYCSGTLSVDKNDLLLFYVNDSGDARRIDFGNISNEELKHLSETCEQATFGRNQESVLDEQYRKSRKLDSTQFVPYLDVNNLKFTDILHEDLLPDGQRDKNIRIERYKLNVYEPGSFFKPHVDTPRGEDMFGSLVIVFPTPHEGGGFVLRDKNKEWTIDAASEMKSMSGPCITYIAFYGDVEHEVLPITAGYRVTITYNLYFDSKPIPPYSKISDDSFQQLWVAFEEMLADPFILPDGGYLGFGLRRQYGLSHTTKLDALSENLKGGDALLMQVCRDLSLDASLRALYYSCEDYDFEKPDDILVDRIPNLQGYYIDSISAALVDECPGALRVARSLSIDFDDRESEIDPDIIIKWVVRDRKNGEVTQDIVTYGNEPSMDKVYGEVCLIVAVGPPQDRRDTKKIKTFMELYESRSKSKSKSRSKSKSKFRAEYESDSDPETDADMEGTSCFQVEM
ncbi:hypothetical protein QCA50_008908 [Cerrena zonata]|uniref:Fe2OG dioxygenase domain-containing protein n=1 Tax=Cerrena zonata TaxID=2478898 RepID=A0AAW0G822_9APHY